MTITKEEKTSISLQANDQAEFEVLQNLVSKIAVAEGTQVGIDEAFYKVIVNTDVQAEITALNAIDQAVIQLEQNNRSKQIYLNSISQKGQVAILEWRSVLYDFLFARQQGAQATPPNDPYPAISNQAVFDEFKDYKEMLELGMIAEVKGKIASLPANHWLVDEFYPIGQTTTKLRDYFISFLDDL